MSRRPKRAWIAISLFAAALCVVGVILTPYITSADEHYARWVYRLDTDASANDAEELFPELRADAAKYIVDLPIRLQSDFQTFDIPRQARVAEYISWASSGEGNETWARVGQQLLFHSGFEFPANVQSTLIETQAGLSADALIHVVVGPFDEPHLRDIDRAMLLRYLIRKLKQTPRDSRCSIAQRKALEVALQEYTHSVDRNVSGNAIVVLVLVAAISVDQAKSIAANVKWSRPSSAAALTHGELIEQIEAAAE